MQVDNFDDKLKISAASRYGGVLAITMLLIIFLGSSIYLQKYHIQVPERRSPPEFELGMLPSGKYVQTVTFGYDTVAAHWLWIRSILAFGGMLNDDRIDPVTGENIGPDFNKILHLFDVITDLEPRFLDAYHFGALVIGEDAGQPAEALKLMDKGIIKNQRRYHSIPRMGVFQSILKSRNNRDFETGKFYLALTLKSLDCPDYINNWAQYIDKEQGQYRVAVEGYLNNYLAALEADNELTYGLREKQLKDCINEWGLSILNQALEEFQELEERLPADLNELLEHECYGDQEIYFWSIIEVELDKLQQARKRLLANRDQILAKSLGSAKYGPENAYDTTGGVKGFIIAPYHKQVFEYHSLRHRVDEFLNGALLNPETGLRAEDGLRNTLKRYYERYQIYPANLLDIPGMTDGLGNPIYLDPFRGDWKYDAASGEVKSWAFPDI